MNKKDWTDYLAIAIISACLVGALVQVVVELML